MLFRSDDLTLLGIHVVGEQATELVHIGLVAMSCGASAKLFSSICFTYPTLGDLYKYASYAALLQHMKPVGAGDRYEKVANLH
jgi:NAD(P) transhydrogenase